MTSGEPDASLFEAAERTWERLGRPPGPTPADLADEARWAADPTLALARLDDLPAAAAGVGGLDREARIALLVLLGGSAHLARVLATDPDWATWLARAVHGQDSPACLARAALASAEALEPACAARLLRRWRQRAYLRIGARDLWGLAPIEETLEALSATADTAIAAAAELARRQLEAEVGVLEIAAGKPNGFGVLGMGKLGARELNYSSDVDLVFLHESEGEPTTGGPRGSLAPLEFFTRLGERTTRLLSEVTDDGFVFRVDLRLRPDGMNGPLTSTLQATLGYYESFGQTWERAAMFKARPVGGDLDLAGRLLSGLAPFIYCRTLDYTMIADLEAMKARVDDQVRGAGKGRRHVKLGPGGIREVEFLVQSFSLVHGGRDRRLRERGTLASLRILVEVGLLDPSDGTMLADAYRWLRRVEHALQIDEDRQVHVLPESGAERAVVARRLALHLDGEGPVWARSPGADALARFESIHTDQTGRVQRAFDDLFRSRRARQEAMDGTGARDLMDSLDAPGVEERLSALGFREPGVAAGALKSIRDGVPESRSATRRTVQELAPVLLSAVCESPDPDRALSMLAEFLQRVGARRTFTALLAENPATLRLLVSLFASSEYLSRVLLQHPELIDTLVRSDLAVTMKTGDEMGAELDGQLAACGDFEEKLDALRRFRSDEMLRIGVHDILGEMHYNVVADQLSALADVCLARAYAIALAERTARYGAPAGLGLAVIAMGKLGSFELNYHSDLDLIFVYGPAADAFSTPVATATTALPEAVTAAESGGLSPHEFFSKVAQLLMMVLQLATREGYVYKIDTRLRPSGRGGPLVTSLEAFDAYHADSAALWERQALVRARVVCGPADLARSIDAVVGRFVYGRGLEEGELAEIARVRRRMEKELAREDASTFNLKMGRGGLVDVEFLAQAAALAHGHAHPELRHRATRRLVDAMGRLGLLSEEERAGLAASYSFLRGLENRLRIEGEHPIERIARDPAALIRTARRMGIEGPGAEPGEVLLGEYDRHRERVRAIYDRLVGCHAPAERPA